MSSTVQISDLGLEPNCSWVQVWGRVGFGSRPGTNLQLGPGLGSGWIRIQAWDQSAVGSRSRSRLDSDPGLGSNLCLGPDLETCWNWTQVQDQSLLTWVHVHIGPILGPRCNLGHSLWNSLSLSLSFTSSIPHHLFSTHTFLLFTFVHFFLIFIYVFLFFMYLIFNGSFFGIYQFISQVHLMALKLHTCVGVQLAGSQYFQSDYSVRSYFHWQLTWTICNLMYLDIICDNVEYMEEMSKWNKLKIFQNVYFMLPAYFLSTKVLFLSVARQSQIILVLKQIYIVIAGVSLPLPSVIWWCYEN